jgi:hypothetical protein
MMDDIDLNEPAEVSKSAPPAFQNAGLRPRIAKRLWERIGLIVTWFRITVLPQYGSRVLASMALITCGRLGDSASFLVGTHILTGSISRSDAALHGLRAGLVEAAISMAGILAGASILGYAGSKLASRLVLEYEDACLVQGLELIRHHENSQLRLTYQERSNITRQAPRTMSRSLLYVINACTSLAMMLIGLMACLTLFPGLTAIVVVSLVLISPFYVLAAVHSTNIGHSIRLSTPGYLAFIRALEKKSLSSDDFDQKQILEEIQGSSDYTALQRAYRERLALPARNHLLSSLTLAFILALSFVWLGGEVEASPQSLTAMVMYLVSLRLFAHGLAGIFHGIQIVNTSLSFYLLFLTRDPRFAK